MKRHASFLLIPAAAALGLALGALWPVADPAAALPAVARFGIPEPSSIDVEPARRPPAAFRAAVFAAPARRPESSSALVAQQIPRQRPAASVAEVPAAAPARSGVARARQPESRASAARPQPEFHAAAAAAPLPELRAVLIDGDRRLAQVGSQLASEGGIAEGWRVVRIESWRAQLLSLDSGVVRWIELSRGF